LVLVGDGPLRAAIESRIRSLGLERHVRLAGWSSGSAVERSICEARALVLPSLAEGISVAAMEAMALGRPVICTDVGGMTELVEHGTHGWVIRPSSVDALVEAMREAALAPAAQLEQMGDRGAARVGERHDAATEALKLLELFRGPARPASTAATATSHGGRGRLSSIAHSAHHRVAATR
jgi:colanic acid/amylovoran biosynthesis glycosyltransferase